MNVLHLKDVKDMNQFGSKAVQLGFAFRNGLPVPEGYALSKTWVQSIAENDRFAIKKLHGIMDDLDSNVAARSSAVEEDGEKGSFAGQFKSYMNLRCVSELKDAILNIRKSILSSHSIIYNHRFGKSNLSGVGDTIQKMVNAD